MKIKNLGLILVGAIIEIVGCTTNNKPTKLAPVEYAQPVHVSKSVRTKRVYSNSNSRTQAGVIKPYATNSNSRVVSLAEDTSTVSSLTGSNSYQVKPGDTLYSIAFRYGKDYRDVARINNIDAPYNITVGQNISLSQATVVSSVSSSSSVKTPMPVEKVPSYYIVKNGDTAVSVARKNGLTFSQLIRANNLKKPYNLYKGQRLSLDASAKNNEVVYTDRTTQKVVPVAGNEVNTTIASNQTSVSTPAAVNTSTPTKIVSGKTTTVSGVSWMWPTKGRVVKNFSSSNKGLDIAGTRGQNVNAAAAGQVVYSGNALRGYGNLIIINHNNEFLSAYAHNDMLLVKEGQSVKRGQVIAKMGSTDATSVKLHFEIRRKGNSVNPRNYLPR